MGVKELLIVVVLLIQVEMVDLVVAEVQVAQDQEPLQQEMEIHLQYLLLKVKMEDKDIIMLVFTKSVAVVVEQEAQELLHQQDLLV